MFVDTQTLISAEEKAYYGQQLKTGSSVVAGILINRPRVLGVW